MNYYALTKKYFPSANVTLHDRTYQGLEWHGPGDKPSEDIFEAYQNEEDRLTRQAGLIVRDRQGQMEEKQRQARAQADADMVPFQKTLGEYFETERLKFLKLKQDALELQARISLKEHALDCWREITEAQEALNKQAQEYLDATKHYLSWDLDKIPADVLGKREDAHKLLSEGQLVYADWARLRESEMPSREELATALRLGGEHLERARKACREVALRYPKPRIQRF